MTLEKIYEMGLIKDNTKIFVRQDEGFHVLTIDNLHKRAANVQKEGEKMATSKSMLAVDAKRYSLLWLNVV